VRERWNLTGTPMAKREDAALAPCCATHVKGYHNVVDNRILDYPGIRPSRKARLSSLSTHAAAARSRSRPTRRLPFVSSCGDAEHVSVATQSQPRHVRDTLRGSTRVVRRRLATRRSGAGSHHAPVGGRCRQATALGRSASPRLPVVFVRQSRSGLAHAFDERERNEPILSSLHRRHRLRS
jgi:hypothetical protein